MAHTGLNTIDLNSDVGESYGRWSLGDDTAMFRSVSSANVACGFHAGDPSVIRRTCREAVAAGVRIGAHVGYRDLAGFGRRFLDIDPNELADDVVYQIGALQALAAAEGGQVSYVKPHGGLYNAIVAHTAQARAVVDAVKSVDPNLPILGLPGSEVLRLAEAAGIRAVKPSRTAPTTATAPWFPAPSPEQCCTTTPRSPNMSSGWPPIQPSAPSTAPS
jgi:UPF0271 protein